MSETASQSIAAAPARRGRRRRRGKSSFTILWIVLGTLAALAAVAVFGFSFWLKSYLQSDRFRVWIRGEISRRLDADVQIDGIQWQNSAAYVGTFTADGRPEAAFSRLEAHDIRTGIDAGAVWDRVWQVDGVKIARVFVDLSAGAPRSATIPAAAPDTPGGRESSGFLSSLLPNRTVVKSVDVDQFGFLWKNSARSAAARNVSLHIKPAANNEFFIASGNGGTLALSALPDVPLTLGNVDATLQGDELTVDRFTATATGADISAEGAILTGQRPSLKLTGTIKGLDLARCLPEDWLKRLKGTAGGDVKVTGDPREFDRLTWSGNASILDGMLEGLPVLHVIARKTRNESFIRLLLKEARTAFTRAADGAWQLEKIMIDAPGLLRLKGTADTSPNGSLHGELLLGIVPGTLRYLAGAEQSVFLPVERLAPNAAERALLTSDDSGLLWTRLRLSGTLDRPTEDLADRLAKAWFNATVDEVLNMSMEGAIKAAETASKAAAEAAGTVIDHAPEVIQKGVETGTDLLQKGVDAGAGLLEKGVEGGLKTIDGLIPRGK